MFFTALHTDPDIFADGWGTKAGAVEEVEEVEESSSEEESEAEVKELTKGQEVEAGRLAARKAAREETRQEKWLQEIESKLHTRVREASSLTLSARTRRALGSGGSRSAVVGVCVAGSGGDGPRFEVAALVRLTNLEGRAKATVTVGAVVVWLSLHEALFVPWLDVARAAVTTGAAAAAARAEEARLLRSNRHLHPRAPLPASSLTPATVPSTSSVAPTPILS